jgi:ribosomal-protein-serine acetyltransferase
MFSHTVREGVVLRLLEERHAAAFYAHVEANRAHLGVWLDEVDRIHSQEDAREFIRQGLQAFASGAGLSLGIWVEGDLAGVVGLGDVQAPNRSAMIGYWLGAGYVGRGLATDAVRVLLDYAFDELGLNRVEITCPSENAPSRAIPERLGFQQEGIRRQMIWLRDKSLDIVIYGMLASEWAARRALREG